MIRRNQKEERKDCGKGKLYCIKFGPKRKK